MTQRRSDVPRFVYTPNPIELWHIERDAKLDALRKEANERAAVRNETDHGPDFRSILWFGRKYSFTVNQSKIVSVLWNAWERGVPDVGDATLVSAIDSDDDFDPRLRDVFKTGKKNHPAWGSMIVPGRTKGTHRLVKPRKIPSKNPA